MPHLGLGAPVAFATKPPAPGDHRSKRVEEAQEVTLLAAAQVQREHQVEELDAVLEREQAAIVKVWRRVLDAAERRRLDWTLRGRHDAVDHPRVVEALE